MRAAIIAFSGRGSRLCNKIVSCLQKEKIEAEGYGIERYAKESGLIPLSEPLKKWTERQFQKADLLIFVGATGIAVRSIAPFVRDKKTDPAVLVADEYGKFVISLLSGHIGGANEWTKFLAGCLGSTPIVTTATDLNEKLAVDVFAVKNKMTIKEMGIAKKIAADFLDEKEVGFLCDFPIIGRIPPELCNCSERTQELESRRWEEGIHVTIKKNTRPFPNTLHLIPKIAVLGIGCKRHTAAKTIENVVTQVLCLLKLERESVEKVCSIDLKKDEEGLKQFCQKWNLLFTVYSKEELEQVQGEFTDSEFVKKIAGISNVCERSAVLGSENGMLIQRKKAADGVTVAVAIKDWSVKF